MNFNVIHFYHFFLVFAKFRSEKQVQLFDFLAIPPLLFIRIFSSQAKGISIISILFDSKKLS